MEEKNERFEYTYSAKQQEEIEQIRRKYLPKEDKLEELRKLDAAVNRTGLIAGLALGIIGTLIFGTGLSIVLLYGEEYMALGIAISVVGFLTLGLAYPAHVKLTQRQKEKLGPRILELAEQMRYQ